MWTPFVTFDFVVYVGSVRVAPEDTRKILLHFRYARAVALRKSYGATLALAWSQSQLFAHGILVRMKDGKKVGITAGAFDLCHAGHMLVFKEAKEVCDYLIVALQEDPSNTPADYRGKKKNKPIMTLEERRIILEGIKYIDEVVVYNTEEELYDLLVQMKPDVRIIGADWKGKQYTGHDLPIEMYFNSRGHNFSTTALRERIYEAEAAKRAVATA